MLVERSVNPICKMFFFLAVVDEVICFSSNTYLAKLKSLSLRFFFLFVCFFPLAPRALIVRALRWLRDVLWATRSVLYEV